MLPVDPGGVECTAKDAREWCEGWFDFTPGHCGDGNGNFSGVTGIGWGTGLRRPARFTNMAVPKFDGTVCWQQHQQVFNAIAKSNGWDDTTAALQLYAHLEGEALSLNVALLMPEDERANQEELADALSKYYNSLGRLASGDIQEEVCKCGSPGWGGSRCLRNGTLAVWGFGDVSLKAWTRMVRDRFIS